MRKILLFLTTLLLFPTLIYAKAPDPSTIQSVTYYDVSESPPYASNDFAQIIPEIQRIGFNTVWLVNPWATFNPQPFAQPPEYNSSPFTSLISTLQTLKEHNMRAIIGLNYLGQGWAPEGINACEWVKDPTNYQAFVQYSTEFLSRIQDYSDMVYILVFTENAVPCSLEPHYEADKAHQVVQLFQETLGNFPKQLPPSLRAKFSIGYHDFSLIDRNWGNGESPIASPNPFDFVSMVGYALEDTNMESLPDADIQAILNTRAQRFKTLYPNLPLVLGEFGASSCNNKDANQARVISTGVTWAKNNHYGFNVWGWKPGPGTEECTNPVYGGLAITNQDGSPKSSVNTLKELLSPSDIPEPQIGVPTKLFGGTLSTEIGGGNGNVYAAFVMNENGTYKMWYGGQGADGHDRIHYAESSDGLNWVKRGVILDNGSSNHVNDPSVIKVGNTYYMYYTDAPSTELDQIHLATSTDGLNWTKQGAMLTGTASWDKYLGRPAVIYEDTTFKMWYDGRVSSTPGSESFIGYATSTDGFNWIRSTSNPVFADDVYDTGQGISQVGAINVRKIGNRYVMVYQAKGTKWASSTDGITWKKRGKLAGLSGTDFDTLYHATPKIFINDQNKPAAIYMAGVSNVSWDNLSIGIIKLNGNEFDTLPGDLDDNDRVDIFDYNLLVASFGHPYTIFDYNQLVANFGRSN